MEIKTTEDVVALMPMKVTTTGADVFEKVDKVLQYRKSIRCCNTESSWSSEGWSANYGPKEQWSAFVSHRGHEEYNGSRFDNTPLPDTPRSEIPQKVLTLVS
jgi:hypothetical protein